MTSQIIRKLGIKKYVWSATRYTHNSQQFVNQLTGDVEYRPMVTVCNLSENLAVIFWIVAATDVVDMSVVEYL